MKQLMLTTALVAVTSLGAIAQSSDTSATGEMQNPASGQIVPAFLVSEFTGKELYTLDTEATRNLRERRLGQERDWATTTLSWESSDTFAAERDAWEEVGEIDNVVLTQDGQVRGILIDVGGFLGIGARSVMVDIDELYFVSDDDDTESIDDFFLVAGISRAELEALPEWDDERLSTSFEARGYTTSDGMDKDTGNTDTSGDGAMDGEAATMDAEPEGTMGGDADGAMGDDMDGAGMPEGFEMMAAEDRTAERLMGANVYSREGDDIATVDDLMIADDGKVSHAVMDVGGFLGIGSHTIALEIDRLDILWNGEDGEVRVQVPMTREELEAIPEHQG